MALDVDYTWTVDGEGDPGLAGVTLEGLRGARVHVQLAPEVEVMNAEPASGRTEPCARTTMGAMNAVPW